MSSIPETVQLDWRGQSCPAPIINTAKAARQLKGRAGVFHILADDPAFPVDLQSWCRSASAQVLSLDQLDDGAYKAVVAVNPNASTPALPASTRAVTPAAQAQPPQAAQQSLDYRGLSCPEPILKLTRVARSAPRHEPLQLEVWADDPAFPLDLQSWSRSAGVEVLSLDQDGPTFRAVLYRYAQAHNTALSLAPFAQTSNPVASTAFHRAQDPKPAPQAAPEQAPQGLRVKLQGQDRAASLRRLSALETLQPEGPIWVECEDAEFSDELMRWCSARGHKLLSLETGARLRASLQLNPQAKPAEPEAALVPATRAQPQRDACTLLVLHNDFEALMAALMTATTAAASGMETTVFFSFWGVNLLRADSPTSAPPQHQPTFMQKVFAWMMPKGPNRQQLGKLNFGGFGTSIMLGLMRDQKIMDLRQLMDSAVDQNVRFLVCTTSMNIMGLDKRDIAPFPNVQYGGVASFVDAARDSKMSLVF